MRAQIFKPQTKKSWFKIEASKTDTAEILIYDEIGGFGIEAGKFVADLGEVSAKTIKVRLNTPGGSVFDGVAIFNALRQHPARIEAHIDGLAASIGSIIALAADSVEMAKNAYFMIHNPWTLTIGDSAELRKTADLLDKIGGTLVQTYQDKTGASDEQVTAWMNNETWFTAQEALEAGFIDEITGDTTAKNRFDLSVYDRVPRNLQTETNDIVDTIRDFEAALRDELGFSHREAKRLAAGGWAAFVRDEQDEADNVVQLLKQMHRDLNQKH